MEAKRPEAEKSRGSKGSKSEQGGGATNQNDKRKFDQGHQRKDQGQKRQEQDERKQNQDSKRTNQDQGRNEQPRREADTRRIEPNNSGRSENRPHRTEGEGRKIEQNSKYKNHSINLGMQNMTLNPSSSSFPGHGQNSYPAETGFHHRGGGFNPSTSGFNPSTPSFNPSTPGLSQAGSGFNPGVGFNGYNHHGTNRPPPSSQGGVPGSTGGPRSNGPQGHLVNNGAPPTRDVPGLATWKVGDQARAKYWEVIMIFYRFQAFS